MRQMRRYIDPAKPEIGYQRDETGVRWIVVGAPESGRADEGGSLNSRTAAVHEAKERARRCGGLYVGDLDRRRLHGAAHAFDLD